MTMPKPEYRARGCRAWNLNQHAVLFIQMSVRTGRPMYWLSVDIDVGELYYTSFDKPLNRLDALIILSKLASPKQREK